MDYVSSAVMDPEAAQTVADIAKSPNPEAALTDVLAADLAEAAHPTGRRRIQFKQFANDYAPKVRAAEEAVIAANPKNDTPQAAIVRGIAANSSNPEADMKEYLKELAGGMLARDWSPKDDLSGLGALGISTKWRNIAIGAGVVGVAAIVAGATGLFSSAAPAAAATAGADAAKGASAGMTQQLLDTAAALAAAKMQADAQKEAQKKADAAARDAKAKADAAARAEQAKADAAAQDAARRQQDAINALRQATITSPGSGAPSGGGGGLYTDYGPGPTAPMAAGIAGIPTPVLIGAVALAGFMLMKSGNGGGGGRSRRRR